MRLFIAIDLDHEDFFKKLQEPLRNVGGVRLTFPSSFHITLKFIGDVDEPMKERIVHALSGVRIEPFALSCDHVGTFPENGQVRVVWAGFAGGGSGSLDAPFKEGYQQIVALAQRIDALLKPLGIGAEKGFVPHVTLARVKESIPAGHEATLTVISKIQVAPTSFSISAIRLIKSTLGRGGPSYGVLWSSS